MAWKKESPEVLQYLEDAVAYLHPERRRMFGHTVFFINGNMFSGIFGEDIFVRLNRDDQAKLFEESDEAQPFEPIEGRPMKEYAVLPESIFGRPDLFQHWLDRSYRYVSSLPPKEKK